MTARKHDHLKLLAGTARPDRAVREGPALPLFAAPPPPPAWLANIDALSEWHRLAPLLVANRLLTAGNIALFGQLCALHGRLVEMWRTGDLPHAAHLAALRSLSNALGLLSISVPAPKSNNRFLSNFKIR